MRYFVLLGFLSAGTYAVAAVLTAALVTAIWPKCRRTLAGTPPQTRAQVLASIRLAPLAVGTAAALTLAGVFLRFEPRSTTESPSLLLIAATIMAVILFSAGAMTAVRSLVGNRQCARLVQACGRRAPETDLPLWIVETPYPVAAVSGVLRPRLILSARILRECSPEEADAILRHEAAHVRRRDNLLRALMLSTPDPLHVGSTGREIQQAWAAAAEEAADDEAAGDRAEVRADLAAALVRVARMVQGPPPSWAIGVAFYEGTNLESRVQRLLSPVSQSHPAHVVPAATTLLILASAAIVAADSLAFRVHALMEAAVNHLP